MSAMDRVAVITQIIDDLKDKYPTLMYPVPLTKAADEFLAETPHG